LCADAVNTKKFNGNTVDYKTIEECMYGEADYIDAKVETYYSVLQAQNSQIKELQDSQKCASTNFLGEKNIDTNCLIKSYAPNVQNILETTFTGGKISDPHNSNKFISVADAKTILSADSFGQGNYNIEQLREIELYSEILKNNPDDELAKSRLYSTLKDVQQNSDNIITKTNWAQKEGTSSSNVAFLEVGGKNIKNLPYSGLKQSNIETKISGLSPNTPVQMLQTSAGGNYIVVLDDSTGKEIYPIKSNSENKLMVYDDKGNLIDEKDLPDELKGGKLYFKKYDTSSYQNTFKSTSGDTEPKVKYYETEPYQGLPAIVPFDKKNGWYAATQQAIPILGNVKAYDASGRVTSFYVCNVGENGREEFKSGIGDDICEQVNTGTGQTYNQFPGLESSQASKLIQNAVTAIEQASRQYKSGVKKVNINVGGSSWTLNVGSPAVDIPDMQCQDFMSPKECQLLFNVCDPVICPSSRCDFAGQYPVKDVIQSGIIGSIALCLPNFREGIFIPVCLSGIKAGIDSYLSVVKSYRDCLQTSLDTGEMVGICDEIYSIHLCEFFWRQGIPLAKLAIPKIVEYALGQNVHGGAEYLSVQNAWESAENSVSYFTQYYAANSFAAFKARTAEDVGEEVCQSFPSATYPDGGDVLGALTEPDSPPQFTGRFDEIPYTDVTNPPISHYKVYYHIYAGKDSRAYYSVYLKGSSTSSFYQDIAQRRIVDSGYIPVGEYVSQTKDFTAPSGYKQLCINVNGQEECDFQQATTSFALNYIKDQYVKEQASAKDITSEAECVSGSPSLYSALNPNLQEGADNLINPSISDYGIIRICATDSPGKGTDAKDGLEGSRWLDVGYCGETKMRCWLDTDSLDEAVQFATTKEDILSSQTDQALALLNSSGYLTDEVFQEKIKEIQEESDSLKKISLINAIFDKVFFNNQKAYLYFLRGNAFGDLAKLNYKKVQDTQDKEGYECVLNNDCEIIYSSSDYSCVENICKRKCNSDDDCGVGYICQGSLCVLEGTETEATPTETETSAETSVTTEETCSVKFLNENFYEIDNINFGEKIYLDVKNIENCGRRINLFPVIKSNTKLDLLKSFTEDGVYVLNLGKGQENGFLITPQLNYLEIDDLQNIEINSLQILSAPEDEDSYLFVEEDPCYSCGTICTESECNKISNDEGVNCEYIDVFATIFTGNSVLDLAKPRCKINFDETSSVSDDEIISHTIINYPVTNLELIGVLNEFGNVRYVSELQTNIEEDFKKCVSFSDEVIQTTQKTQVDNFLLLAMIMQESSCKPNSVSDANPPAYGLMQITEGTFEDVCLVKDSSLTFLEIKTNPQKNIDCGAEILNNKKEQFGNGVKNSWSYKNSQSFRKTADACIAKYPKYAQYRGWDAALAAYNGWGCASSKADPNYVESVLERYDNLYAYTKNKIDKTREA